MALVHLACKPFTFLRLWLAAGLLQAKAMVQVAYGPANYYVGLRNAQPLLKRLLHGVLQPMQLRYAHVHAGTQAPSFDRCRLHVAPVRTDYHKGTSPSVGAVAVAASIAAAGAAAVAAATAAVVAAVAAVATAAIAARLWEG